MASKDQFCELFGKSDIFTESAIDKLSEFKYQNINDFDLNCIYITDMHYNYDYSDLMMNVMFNDISYKFKVIKENEFSMCTCGCADIPKNVITAKYGINNIFSYGNITFEHIFEEIAWRLNCENIIVLLEDDLTKRAD